MTRQILNDTEFVPFVIGWVVLLVFDLAPFLVTPRSLDILQVFSSIVLMSKVVTCSPQRYVFIRTVVFTSHILLGALFGNVYLGTLLQVCIALVELFARRANNFPFRQEIPLKGYEGVHTHVFECLLAAGVFWLVEFVRRSELAASFKEMRGRETEALVLRLLSGICDATAVLNDSLIITEGARQLATLLLRQTEARHGLRDRYFPNLVSARDRSRVIEFLPQELQRQESKEPACMLHVDFLDGCCVEVPASIFVSASEDSSGRISYLLGIIVDQALLRDPPPAELAFPSDAAVLASRIETDDTDTASASSSDEADSVSMLAYMQFNVPSLTGVTMSEAFEQLLRGSHPVNCFGDLVVDREGFDEWIRALCTPSGTSNETLELTSDLIQLRVPRSRSKVVYYDIILNGIFHANSVLAPDIGAVEVTMIECTRVRTVRGGSSAASSSGGTPAFVTPEAIGRRSTGFNSISL